MRNTDSPAYRLTGRTLPEGWMVTNYSLPPSEFSRGHNSVGYLVESFDGRIAFLKAVDYHESEPHQNVPDRLYEVSKAFRYERDLMKLCRDADLSGVAKLIDDGGIDLEDNNLDSRVDYLIIERANKDIRPYVGHRENSKISRVLNMMHQVTVATQQLHSMRIAHQDIKPGNVLVYDDVTIKLGDLGQATQMNNPSPYDSSVFPGDPNYAPPEFLYRNPGIPCLNWKMRRLGCDFYMLGSVMLYMITGLSMNHILLARLARSYLPKNWSGTYEDVFPYLQHSFSECKAEIERTTHSAVSSEITSVVMQLCDLRPEKRGLPMNQGFNQFSLQRFVSRLNYLYKKNQLAPWRNAPISEKVM